MQMFIMSQLLMNLLGITDPVPPVFTTTRPPLYIPVGEHVKSGVTVYRYNWRAKDRSKYMPAKEDRKHAK